MNRDVDLNDPLIENTLSSSSLPHLDNVDEFDEDEILKRV